MRRLHTPPGPASRATLLYSPGTGITQRSFTTARAEREGNHQEKETNAQDPRSPKTVTAVPPAELLTSLCLCSYGRRRRTKKRYLYGHGNTFPFVSRTTIFFSVCTLQGPRYPGPFIAPFREGKDDRLFIRWRRADCSTARHVAWPTYSAIKNTWVCIKLKNSKQM